MLSQRGTQVVSLWSGLWCLQRRVIAAGPGAGVFAGAVFEERYRQVLAFQHAAPEAGHPRLAHHGGAISYPPRSRLLSSEESTGRFHAVFSAV